MQKKTSKRILCLLLTFLTIFPLIVATGMFTASAAGETYRVVKTSEGSIQYAGKNYATGATNSRQEFEFNSGFLLENESRESYWGTCIRSGYKDPPLGTIFSTRTSITDLLIDGLNQKDAQGSHYIVSPVSGGNDSTAGRPREINARFVFACFYYANKYKATEFSALSVDDCTLQEAVAIAYRYEWDVRLIKYGNTGTWNNTTKQWTTNPVSSWTENTTHFGGVTDGDSTHQAIVDAANAILKYAISDPDGVRAKVQSMDGGTRLVYADENGTNEMFSLAGPARTDSTLPYQDLLLFRGPEPDDGPETYTLRISKTDEDGNELTGAGFALYQKINGTYRYVSSKTTIFGIAGWNDLEAGDYYVVETTAPGGYELDTTRHYVTLPPANGSTTVRLNISNKKIVKTGSWAPNVNKVYEGHDLEDGQFEFQLWKNSYSGSSENLLQTVRNRADGSIPFESIQYTSADIGKEYTYYVRESSPSINGVLVKDSHVVKYTIKISDPGTGTELTVTESVTGSTTFTNKGWDAKYGAIGVMKVDQFGNPVAGVTFDLYNDDTGFYLGTITTDESGVATYGIGGNGGYTLDAGQSYAMREISAPDGYIVDSATWYDATVVAGQLTYVNNGEPVLNPTATGSWAPNVNKVLNGRELQDSEFTFVLEKDGEILQAVKNTADGSIPFVTVEYTASDIGKTYTYTIRELIGEDGTVIYDSHTVTYTVKVSYSGTGTELSIEVSTSGGTTFTNELACGAIGVKKVDAEGKPLAGAIFTIYADGGLADPVGTMATVADGVAVYGVGGDGAYTLLSGTTYYVKETSAPFGYAKDPTVYEVTVVTGQITYVNNGGAIPNYPITGSWTPNVDKVLIGRELQDGEFTFVLEENGVELQRATNLADGSIPFGAIHYTVSDLGQHTYIIRELTGEDGSVVYDGHTVTYSVLVSYNDFDSKLDAFESVSGSTTFANYIPTGSRTPDVDKVLIGRELQDGEFTFVLEKDGVELQRVTNLADGSIPFEAIEYTASDIDKTYTYTIRELTGEDSTVVYDDHTVTYTVKVSYSGTGTELTIETSTSGSTTFTNYIPIGNWTPDVDKVLDGRELQDGEFTFVLEKGGVELQRVTNLANGSISFEAIEYTAADIGRIYTYTIRELTGEDSTVVYDDHTVTYTVKVSYSGTGIELTIEDSTSDSTTFTNYVPIGSWTPDVDKILEGRDLTEGEFTFVLEKEGETEPLQTVQNAADGSIPFAAIYFDLTDAGEHKYTIRELPGDDQIIYDDHKVTYTVTVAQSGTKLDVSAAAEGDKTFTNRLSTGKIEILKTDPYGTILSGAEFLLEWSEDGNEWFPVTAATELVMGGCTAAGLIDGKLITDEDGRAVFDGLYPTLYYRLTETKAPEGMQLLATCAFEGLLSDREDLTVSLRVVNSPKFTIPNTGDRGFGYLMLAVPALCCIAAAILIAATDKRKKV